MTPTQPKEPKYLLTKEQLSDLVYALRLKTNFDPVKEFSPYLFTGTREEGEIRMNRDEITKAIGDEFAPIGTDESERLDEINGHRADGAIWAISKFIQPKEGKASDSERLKNLMKRSPDLEDNDKLNEFTDKALRTTIEESPSTPGERTAQQVLTDEMYKEQPDWTDLHEWIEEYKDFFSLSVRAMESYASPLRAEIERLKASQQEWPTEEETESYCKENQLYKIKEVIPANYFVMGIDYLKQWKKSRGEGKG